MKERPILFNSEMVNAILKGQKTQTRRLKGLNKKPVWSIEYVHSMGGWYVKYPNGPDWEVIQCPYGKPGDRLWVRETWRPWSWQEGEPIGIQFKADMKHRECWTDCDDIKQSEWEERLWIQITDELDQKGIKPDEYGYYHFDGDPPLRWRPSIFMPRWASRITLEITEVRIDRLQEISLHDINAEGTPDTLDKTKRPFGSRREHFQRLWDSINAKRGFPWDKNPWVWVISFKVVK